jgi:outer membrane biosynthesis protein TonB
VKLTFEGPNIREIFYQMEATLKASMFDAPKAPPTVAAPKNMPDYIFEAPAPVDKPVDKPVNKPVDKPVDKPVNKPVEIPAAKKGFTEEMRKAKAAKAAAKRVEATVEEPEEPAAEKPALDVNEIVKIRQRTVVDLQEAYANGRQKEVFELLSRFGNGAKSFRELTADAFLPIREAIDAGALK